MRREPFPPWPEYGEEEIATAIEVLRSGNLARQSGSRVQEFEAAFAQKFGVRYAIAVSSGTAAIHVALAALGIGFGDEVINTSHCFIGTATPVLHAGAVPVFADIDPRTFNIDPQSIKQKITPYTKAIVPVHLNGCPADMDAIRKIAQAYDLYVVEDAAQAHGARYRGELVGTLGDVGCFSFWEDKILTTAGEGGMLITNDERVARLARMIHHHGELREDGDYYQGERLYHHPFLGYNFRMTEIQGAIGLAQLEKLEAYVAGRQANAHRLSGLLADVRGVQAPYEPEYAEHAFYKYILRLDRNHLHTPASEFVEALRAEGIRCSRRYPTPLHQQPVFVNQRGLGDSNVQFSAPLYQGSPHYGSGLPYAEQLPEDLVMVRMAPNLQPGDLEDIARAVKKVADYFQEENSLNKNGS